jgi:hypothetical protein
VEILQIAITGPVGAGKTSFVRAISEIDVVDTERRATDATAFMKPTTTVALDFGRLTLDAERALYLYGTPGQFRFDFMWDLIVSKAHAYILLLAAHRPQDFRSGQHILNFINQLVQIPMIVGLTHTDCEGAWDPDDIALALGFPLLECPPIVSVNATDPSSVVRCLLVLLQQLSSAA